MVQFLVDDIIKTALLEDVNYIDAAADNLLDPKAISKAKFLAKASGVLAGIDVALRVFELLGDFKITKYIEDGSAVNKGDIIAEIEGPTVLLLKGEEWNLKKFVPMDSVMMLEILTGELPLEKVMYILKSSQKKKIERYMLY